MKLLRCLLPVITGMLLAVTVGATALPMATTVTQATKFEIMRDGKVVGSVSVPKGVELEVIGLDGASLQVRHRSLTGRVPVAHTGLAALAAALPAEPATAAAAPAPTPATSVAAPAGSAVPTVMARRLQGKLVWLQGGGLQPHEAGRLDGVKFYALYFSAGWCGPCRQFTPRLVEAYAKLRAEFPEFEVVFVSADRSAGDMKKYMGADRMAWPALRHEAIPGSAEIMRYGGEGIPCLVLVDAAGKVLSDTYRGGDYVGPQAVLADTREILQRHRQRNPRPTT